MNTVDVTKLSRDELEEAVLTLSSQVRRLMTVKESQTAQIETLENQVEFLGDKLMTIRNYLDLPNEN